MNMEIPDLAEHLLGIDAASPLGRLRRERADILKHEEGAYRELVLPPRPGRVSLAERAALALRGALIEGDAVLAAHYRALLAACGLDFEPACLRFHETARAIRTPSSLQVRQPMRAASTPAQRYGPLLDPLRDRFAATGG